MNLHLQLWLPLFCVLYFLFLFVFRAIDVGRKIGKNPIVLTHRDDAHGLISKYFTLWLVALGGYALVFAFFPKAYEVFLPSHYLEYSWLQVMGLIILGLSLVLTWKAQGDMRNSWRVGIDEQQKTELITTGAFKYSRNPIYVGMLLSIAGLVLTTPNGFTFLLAVVGYIMIQIQVRLEEDFLSKQHGKNFLSYKDNVGRFI